MKKILVTIIVAAMTAAISCNPISQDTASGHAPKRDLSVGIIIDGTDLKSQQSSIPVVTTKFLREFTDVFQQKASGSVFVTYIDDDFRNNGEPVFANFNYSIPEPVSKRGDETGEEFKSRLTRYREDSAAVAQKMATDFQSFVNEANAILEEAYSPRVFESKRGSDVFGGINCGIRNLESTCSKEKVLIVISDLDHNMPSSTLDKLPEDVKMYVVCGTNHPTIENYPYTDLVTLEQIYSVLF